MLKTISNVTDELHRPLMVRAASVGMTLSDYLLSEIEQMAAKPTMMEWLERVAKLELVEPPEVTIRRMLDADDLRDAELRLLLVVDASAAVTMLLNLRPSAAHIRDRLEHDAEVAHISPL